MMVCFCLPFLLFSVRELTVVSLHSVSQPATTATDAGLTFVFMDVEEGVDVEAALVARCTYG